MKYLKVRGQTQTPHRKLTFYARDSDRSDVLYNAGTLLLYEDMARALLSGIAYASSYEFEYETVPGPLEWTPDFLKGAS